MIDSDEGSKRSPIASDSSFHPLTSQFLERAERERRKSLGQYFTPRALRDRLLDRVRFFDGMRILDPAAGTGEFLASCRELCPTAQLHGFEIDPELARIARQVCPDAVIEIGDALVQPARSEFDLVVGNPPYFQFQPTRELRQQFAPVISGRPNIFAMFFQLGLAHLKPGGQLAFVVPPSMNNGAYFESLRRYVLRHARIEHLEVIEDPFLFAEAQTAVQCIVLEKGAQGEKHVVRIGVPRFDLCGDDTRTPLFAADPTELSREAAGRDTLDALGFVARTGTIVWNQHRSALREQAAADTVPLIWAHNVGIDGLDLTPRQKKPSFVVTNRFQVGPAIVVNRITGLVGSGRLRAALIPEGMRFAGENHVNVIVAKPGASPSVTYPELLALLRAPEVRDRMRRITGNTQLSATELTHMLPLG